MTRNLEKILDADPDFFTPARLALVTEDEIRAKVFDSNAKFALVDERARLVRQVGSVLRERGQTFAQFVS